MTNEKALREQSVGKLLVSLSLPVILIMVVQVLYNMADVFFLGRSGDPLQVAGVSLAMPVFAVFSAFNTLIGFGGSTAASLALGSGEKQKVKQYSAFVLYAGLGLGVLMGIAVMLFLQLLLRLLGTDTQTAAYTGSYLKIMAAGAPFVGVYQLCSVYLQSTGRVAYATVTALMQKGLVYVPVLYGMNAAFGLTGLIFSAAVTDVVSMLAAVALCMKSAKQF